MSSSQPSWFARLGRPLLAAMVVFLCLALLARAGIVQSVLSGTPERLRGRTPRTVLRVWDWWSPATQEKYAVYYAQIKRAFEEKHPDVEVVFQFVPFGQYQQKMTTALVGNSPPDVFQSSVIWAEGFYDRGMLLPLNRFLERERAERQRRQTQGLPIDTGQIVDKEAFLESAWRHNTKTDGAVFGIPQVLDASALMWNLDLLRQAKDDPDIRAMYARKPDGSPDDSRLRWDALRDWEHFRRVVRKLTKYEANGRLLLDGQGEFVQAGFAIHAHGSGAWPFDPWCATNGSGFQDAAGTRAEFASESGIAAMQFLLDLYWKEKVSPPFRRQISNEEMFNQGKIACVSAGTWSPRYVRRDTEGRIRPDVTAFPPGPKGDRSTTLTWGNMLVISSRTPHPDLAWEYVKTVTALEGSLRILKYAETNSPRKDFYQRAEWQQECDATPALHNIPMICASGKKLRHTQTNAVDYATQPFFETMLLRAPDIEKGQGPYPSVRAGLERAAAAANRVYRRYGAQVAEWHQKQENEARP